MQSKSASILLARARFRIAALGAALLLAGCLISETQVFAVSPKDDVPGITGRWDIVRSGKTDSLFITRIGDGSFSTQLNRDPASAMRWNAVAIGDGQFIAQKLDSNRSELHLIQVLPTHLVVFMMRREDIRAASAQFGIRLKEGSTGPYMAAGANPNSVIAMFQAFGRRHDVERSEKYRRAGGFVDPDGADNTIGALDQAIASNDGASTVRVGRYLADRGSAEAQLKLAKFYARNALHALAIQYGLQAAASGDTDAAPLLASLYRAGGDERFLPAGAPSVPDYDQALYWLAMSVIHGPNRKAARSALSEWAHESCVAGGLSEPTKLANCTEVSGLYAMEKVKSHETIMAALERLVENSVATATLQDRVNARNAEIQGLEDEKKALLERKARLQQQQQSSTK